jgi:hypothetical protein
LDLCFEGDICQLEVRIAHPIIILQTLLGINFLQSFGKTPETSSGGSTKSFGNSGEKARLWLLNIVL